MAKHEEPSVENMVRLNNLNEETIAVRFRGRRLAPRAAARNRAARLRERRGPPRRRCVAGRVETAGRSPAGRRALPRAHLSTGRPRPRRRTWRCASDKTRFTPTLALCSSPSTHFACCRCTPPTCLRSALPRPWAHRTRQSRPPRAAYRGRRSQPRRAARLGQVAPSDLVQQPPGAPARVPRLPNATRAPQASRPPPRALWAWLAGAPRRACKPHRYCAREPLTLRRDARYHENGSVGQKPHTYAIADNAYRNLVRDWKARRSALRNTTPPQVARPARAATPGLERRCRLQSIVRTRSRVPRRLAGPKHHRVWRVWRWQD